MRTLAGDRRDFQAMRLRELKRTWSQGCPASYWEPVLFDERQRERCQGSRPAAANAVAFGTPISAATPTDRCCPGCRIFETEPGAEFCPRCTRIRANRLIKADEQRRHFAGIERERRSS